MERLMHDLRGTRPEVEPLGQAVALCMTTHRRRVTT